jgi:hypothetical protein
LAFNIKIRSSDDEHAATAGKIAIMREPRIRSENLPPQHPICTLTITLPDYTGPLPSLEAVQDLKRSQALISNKYAQALAMDPQQFPFPHEYVSRKIGPDWFAFH